MAPYLERSTIDGAKAQALVGKVIDDLGATVSTAMVSLGDRLRLFEGLADRGPSTPAELAATTGTVERYVREWLAAAAASGYVDYDPDGGRFSLSPEQEAVLVDVTSPFHLVGGFEAMLAAARAEPAIADDFRAGSGFSYLEQDARLFDGSERFFGPTYAAYLTRSWIPALDGVGERLERGARVADIGCGHGVAMITLAEAYPASTFVGFDSHQPSITRATDLAAAAGVDGRVRFEVASATSFLGRGYDLITNFDSLHDFGDPVGAARRVREALAPDGTWMIVEPSAGDHLEDNINPVGRLFYGASTLICIPHSLSDGGPSPLGAQAGEARLRAVAEAGGFGRVRRAAETPVYMVLEARP